MTTTYDVRLTMTSFNKIAFCTFLFKKYIYFHLQAQQQKLNYNNILKIDVLNKAVQMTLENLFEK